MNSNRTKNATRNMVFASILKVYQISVPFLMRTIMIYFLGVEYLGLNSLFTSILQILNLAELGVGSAMVFSMYKPIATEDSLTICALMKLYKIYYRIIGIVILGAGILLIPFLPNLISGEVPEGIDIHVLYLLNLSATVLTYWLYAYKNSILQAHQRGDVKSKISLATDTIKYLLQILTLIVLKNYYYYVIVILITQVMTNIITAYMSNKLYPNYQPSGSLPIEVRREINKRIRNLFTAKVATVVVNSSDTIIISAFLGLTALALHQNYYYIITAILGMTGVMLGACSAGIGNSLAVETKEKNYKDLSVFTFIIAWIAGWCTTCLLCLYQPFMKIWVGETLMLEYFAVICFSSYYYIYQITSLMLIYKDASGLWYEDRYRPLITSLVNITLNLIFIRFMGLYGVVLSTFLSFLLVGTPWLIHNLFKFLFERSARSYVYQLLYYTVITICISCVTIFVCNYIQFGLWANLIIKAGICCILPNILFWVFYRKKLEFKQGIALLGRIIKQKTVLKK